MQITVIDAAIGIGSSIIGAVVGAVTAYVMLRKDKRDEADHTIELLKEQNKLLTEQLAESKAQGEKREEEWQERRREWARREQGLEKRVETLEAWQRDEASARRRLQMCAKAPDCADYDPGTHAECTD